MGEEMVWTLRDYHDCSFRNDSLRVPVLLSQVFLVFLRLIATPVSSTNSVLL